MIYVIGIGPGSLEMMTAQAKQVITEVDTIVGYKTYIGLIKPLISQQVIIENGMRGETARCQEALKRSRAGEKVAVISSGDSGVYGMAGLIYELSDGKDEIEVIPGVTASIACAATLGAPLMHDFCHISLSDLLTPYDTIMKRIKHAAAGDFVICLYNPKSKGRPHHIENAIAIIREEQGSDLWVGLVKNAGRDHQSHHIFKIDAIDYSLIDMTSLVIIGNQSTQIIHEKMVTPRGYQL